jgi:hypothetical protein
MLNYLRLFLDLCFFRQSAENIPRSDTLLLVTGAAAIVSGALNAMPDDGIVRALLLATSEVVLFAGGIWIALRLRGHRDRWIQTMTGIYGATTLLQLLTLPLFGWHTRLVSPDSFGLTLTLPLIAIAGIAIWSLAVMTSILRQAMQIPIGAAILIIIGCQAALLMVLFSVTGSAGS